MKFKIGQEVMIVSGAISGRKATVLSYELIGGLHWCEVEVKDMFDSIFYLECELDYLQ
ncbi:putative ribosome protein [Proteus phage vB_PmiM_ZX7]|nr:putative ribosome protein [Proteus phage vB_PmiM_ZX7]